MNRKKSLEKKATLSHEFLATHFPAAVEEKREPTLLEVKERVLELHESGDQEAAAELLKWREQTNKKEESKLSKASKVVMFSLFVIAGILGALWFMNGGAGGGGHDSLVVCSIKGSIHSGDDCNPERQETAKPSDSGSSAEKNDDILIGSE